MQNRNSNILTPRELMSLLAELLGPQDLYRTKAEQVNAAAGKTKTPCTCPHCGAAQAEPVPKPENKNVARAVRCGGEVLYASEILPGNTVTEDCVVFSFDQLDAFVSACGKVDRV